MNRTHAALKLMFTDYPLCKSERVMSAYAAAKQVGVSASAISVAITNLHKHKRCPTCHKPITSTPAL